MQSKCWDHDPKLPRGSKVHHGIKTTHAAKGRVEQAAALVGVRVAGTQHGFLTYYALAIHGFQAIERILDTPVATGELHTVLTLVCDGDKIGMGKVHF